MAARQQTTGAALSMSTSFGCSPDKRVIMSSAAFKAGAAGMILSRKYSEMKLTNLSGAAE
jgi:hypothetical protein